MQHEQKEFVPDEGRDFNINGISFNSADYITKLLQENERLLKENDFLKHYLVSLRNNATLKTASIITTVLSWTDDQLCQRFEDLLVKERGELIQDYTSDDPNRSQQSARIYAEEMQSTAANQEASTYESSSNRQVFPAPPTTGRYPDESTQQRTVNEPQQSSQNLPKSQCYMSDNIFRPISPSRMDLKNHAPTVNFPKNRSQDQQHFQRIPPSEVNQYFDRTDSILKPQSRSSDLKQISPTTILPTKHQAPVPFNDKLFEPFGGQDETSFNTLPTKVIDENYNPPQERIDSINQSYLTRRVNPNAPPQDSAAKNKVEETTDWNSLVYRPPEMIKASDGPVMNQASFGPKRSGSEGYGSQIETDPNYSIQSDGQNRLGDPVASSTPKKGGNNYTQDNTFREMNAPRKSHSNRSSKTAVSVLHRPIDAITGLKPLLTESHRQKLSKIQPSKRIIGEIAFQLDRRILEYVFTGKQTEGGVQERRRRFYGYSISNIGTLIRKEATDKSGQFNPKREIEMRYRFDYIIKSLITFGYILEKHSVLSQELVNRFGLLSGPPDRKIIHENGLDDPVLLRVLLNHLIRDDALLQETLVILDCLCLLSHDDKKTIFCY